MPPFPSRPRWFEEEIEVPYPQEWPIPVVEDTFGTVTGVSSVIVAANDNRLDLEIVNDSDVTIYLARGNAAVVGSGIRLNAAGGSYSMSAHNLFLGYIAAISTGDEQDEDNVTISEGSNNR